MKIKRIVSYIITSFILTVVMASCAGGSIGHSNLPPLRSDQRFANSQGIYDTEKYYYLTYSYSLVRYDKQTKSKETLADYDLGSVAYISDDCIYYTKGEDKYTLYKISDEDIEPETMYELSTDKIYFLNDKYIYSVSPNGSITRSLNSPGKFYDSAEVIYTGSAYIQNATMYKNHIYYISGSGGELVSVSLEDGTSNILADNLRVTYGSTNKYYFAGENGDKIVYVTNDNRLFSCDLDGNNTIEYPENAYNMFVVNNYIYYNDVMKGFRIPVGNNSASALDTLNTKFCGYDPNYVASFSDVGIGVMTRSLELYDYDGNKIGW